MLTCNDDNDDYVLTCHDDNDNDDDDNDDYMLTCHSDPLHIPPGRCIPQCPCYTPNKCNVTPISQNHNVFL